MQTPLRKKRLRKEKNPQKEPFSYIRKPPLRDHHMQLAIKKNLLHLTTGIAIRGFNMGLVVVATESSAKQLNCFTNATNGPKRTEPILFEVLIDMPKMTEKLPILKAVNLKEKVYNEIDWS